MTSPVEPPWSEWGEIIRQDVAGRGLSSLAPPTVSGPAELAAACAELASAESIAIVTGFCILRADPPAGETDGPPGAVAIARVLHALGRRVVLLSDRFGAPLLRVGCRFWGLPEEMVEECPIPAGPDDRSAEEWLAAWNRRSQPTHLLSIERVGPSHTLESLTAQAQRHGLSADETRALMQEFAEAVPQAEQGGCYNMRGLRLDPVNAPLHHLFDEAESRRLADPQAKSIRTIGVGDGGNEIGMGRLDWRAFHRGLPSGLGGKIACRSLVDHLIVAGVSNWGGYALACGLACLRTRPDLIEAHDASTEQNLIRTLVADAGAVDGFSGQREPLVDGLSLEAATAPLAALRRTLGYSG
ncbi:MAG TPA: glutamate cyclase domain-containing protein [Pirellulales bacterium]